MGKLTEVELLRNKLWRAKNTIKTLQADKRSWKEKYERAMGITRRRPSEGQMMARHQTTDTHCKKSVTQDQTDALSPKAASCIPQDEPPETVPRPINMVDDPHQLPPMVLRGPAVGPTASLTDDADEAISRWPDYALASCDHTLQALDERTLQLQKIDRDILQLQHLLADLRDPNSDQTLVIEGGANPATQGPGTASGDSDTSSELSPDTVSETDSTDEDPVQDDGSGQQSKGSDGLGA